MTNKQWIIVVGVIILLTLVFIFYKSTSGGSSSTSSSTTSNVNSVTSSLSTNASTTTSSTNLKTMEKPTSITIDTTKTYQAIMKTDQGDITIDLTAAATPNTVNNFVYLAQQNFYDNVIFHRVISGFMIQGGDPTGTGTGGPGYKFDDEPFTGEYVRGTVAMANAGPNTNGSQFFIVHKDTGLPKSYVIFGNVSNGMDVIDKIASAPTVQDGRENSKPVTPVKILSVSIVTK